jgi:multiple sugar transport system ATP-binding protein
MAEIRIENVAKRFGSYTALEDIDLDVADQEFLVLLGASGCGKTTLLRLIAGLDFPTAGDISIGGRRVNDLAPRERGIAMVFQNYAVFPHLTVFENIAFGLRMKKLPQADIDKRVRSTAGLMHIEQLLQRYSGQLSGGQRQRVAVARAMAMEPDVLLMDEPLSNLDALLRLEMRAELKGVLQESRTTTIYVTHDQVEAMSLADRIAVMDQGRIVQAASPTEVYRDPATRFVGGFIGNPPMNFLPAERSNGGWRVAGFATRGPDLPGPIEFAIRPEDVAPAEAGLAGRVRVVEPLGPHQLVSLDVAGHLFRAVLETDLSIHPGETLTLAPRPERVRWFDPESGAAIQ